MGVNSLWELLAPAGDVGDTLCTLAEKGFRRPSIRSYRVGVDASAWLYHADIYSYQGMDTEEIGAAPELRMLHFRLLHYMRRGISLVVVFDGPGRPDWKRNRYISKSGNMKGLETPLKNHLDMFGVPWIVAGGEAEAELAQMNARGEIDAVVSDDSDAFVFGCETLIRNKAANKLASPSKSSQSAAPPASEANVLVYEAHTIYTTLGMDRDGLIFIALVSGGDYSDGIPGMGEKISMDLMVQGYGTSLMGILRGSSGKAREGRLEEWRQSVREVLVRGNIGNRKHRALAEKVDDSFPDLRVVDLYLDPVINAPRPINWDGEIDIERLTPYVARKFQWWDRKVLSSFQNTLLEAHLRQQLRKTALAIDANLPREVATLREDLGRSLIRIKDDKNRKSKDAEGALCYRVEISPRAFFGFIKIWFEVPEAYPFERSNFNQVPDVENEAIAKKIYHSLPSKLLEFSFPAVVETFRDIARRKDEELAEKELAKVAKQEVKVAREEAKLLREEAKREKALRKEQGLDSSPVKRGKKRAEENKVEEEEEEDVEDSDGADAVRTITMKNKRDWIREEVDVSPSRKKPLRKPRIRKSNPAPPPPSSDAVLYDPFASTAQRSLSPPASTPALYYHSDLESPPKRQRRTSPRLVHPIVVPPPRRLSSVASSAGQSATSTRSWMEDQPRTKPSVSIGAKKKKAAVLELSSDTVDEEEIYRMVQGQKTRVVGGRLEIDLCSSD